MNGREEGSATMLTQSYQVSMSTKALSPMASTILRKLKNEIKIPRDALSDDHRISSHLSIIGLPQQVIKPQPTGSLP